MRIYLVGFMGVGKTTLGKKLAKAIGCKFIDLDKEIEKREQTTIDEMFEAYGEDYFRIVEREVLELTLSENVVISTGGGTPCYYNNMEFIKQQGFCIYLKADPALILQRISRYPGKRPILKGVKPESMLDFIQEKLSEREVVYSRADLVIKIPVKSFSFLVKSVVSELDKRLA